MMSDEAKSDVETERSRKIRQRRLGDQLRRIYEDVTTEPVPDEFLNLLEQADQSSNKK